MNKLIEVTGISSAGVISGEQTTKNNKSKLVIKLGREKRTGE